MAREYKLTWRDHDQRWRKVYKGRTLYFPGEGGKQASYPKAWRDFLAAKAEIDAEIKAAESKSWQSKPEIHTADFLAAAIKRSGLVLLCCEHCGEAMIGSRFGTFEACCSDCL
jgi:hypothetical protein